VSSRKIADRIDLPHLSPGQVRVFKSLFSFLNEKDQDILFLFFVSRKKQKDVQRILRRGQPSLCYDIKRIRQRLKFIVYLHSVFDIFLEFIAIEAPKIFSRQEIAILTLMFYTSSFTLTGRHLKLSQVKVRYVYQKCLKRLEEAEMWEPYEIFLVIQNNLNIIRRVYKGCKKRTLPLPL
jgi:hypothetical protein